MATAPPGDRAHDQLRFILCGSVDDGKSTLIGRLLHDCGAIPDDQLAAATQDSARFGTQGAALDLALLLDGLAAEREQAITIDVAYRYFATPNRSFVVADAPGHEQYTRNMVTGASTADAAIILVDARKGVLTQTRRHSHILRLVGVHHVILAVNKVDLIGFDQATYDAIVNDYAAFAQSIGLEAVSAIPLSALSGDNVVERSPKMPWYDGPTLLERLETLPVSTDAAQARPFRMPVQWTSRPNPDFRGYAGLIAAGTVAPGDQVRIAPSGRTATVARIVTFDGDLTRAGAGRAVTLTLAEDVACARGDVIGAADAPVDQADIFEATLIWLSETALIPGRGYWLKLGTRTVGATVQPPKYRINVDTLEHLATKTLDLNAIGVIEVATDAAIPYEPYEQSRTLGGFILIDRVTNDTVAAGMLHFALRRANNIHPQALDVSRQERAASKHQRPAVLWLTGLSGAGKSTIANLVERRLHAMGHHTFLLDGDNVRHGLSRDLGFSEVDRIENIRRIGEVARLMTDAGLIVITAFISPFRAERELARAMMADGEFIEVHVDTPLAVAEGRDVKGLYRKARAGELSNFTGLDSPYEAPENPELRIDTTQLSAEAAADLIVAHLATRA